jgi:phage terminase large subunit
MLDDPGTVRVQVARAFKPFLGHARYKAAFGGRGSGKSHFFAEQMIVRGFMEQTRAVCIREVQNTIKDSVKQLLTDKINALDLGSYFDVLESEIRGRNGSLIIFRGMQSYNADSIKSLENYDIAWVEEAQTLGQRSLDILRPTIRKERSELWFSWNPESELDAVDLFFRGKNPPTNAVIRQVNWDDNPWFPDVLRLERNADLAKDPEKHDHIWGGGYRQAAKGSYYGPLLAKAKAEGRIGRVPHDPGLEVHVSFDLGVGKNMALFFWQWVGREIRAIDYLEGNDEAAVEGLSWYARKLREKPYTYAPLILPHDARSKEIGTGNSREETLIGLGFKTKIVPKMNPEDRIELVKRFVPMMYVDAERCGEGLKLLRDYREDWDEKNRVSRGPKHDYTSHAADAFGHGVQAYEEPQQKRAIKSRMSIRSGAGWMG